MYIYLYTYIHTYIYTYIYIYIYLYKYLSFPFNVFPFPTNQEGCTTKVLAAAANNIGTNRSMKLMLTVKYSVIFGHACAQRIQCMLKGVGIDSYAELLSQCDICS